MAKKEQEKPGLNIIAKAAIMEEAIKKEMRHHKLTTVFSINPHRPIYLVTGKPNSDSMTKFNVVEGEDEMQQIVRRTQARPTERYDYPMTENQEYGWISTPLHKTDVNDSRVHFAKQPSDVTIFTEHELKLGQGNLPTRRN